MKNYFKQSSFIMLTLCPSTNLLFYNFSAVQKSLTYMNSDFSEIVLT